MKINDELFLTSGWLCGKSCKKCGQPTTGYYDSDEHEPIKMECVNCQHITKINTEIFYEGMKKPKEKVKKNPKSKDYQMGFVNGVKFAKALFGKQADCFKAQLEKTIGGFETNKEEKEW